MTTGRPKPRSISTAATELGINRLELSVLLDVHSIPTAPVGGALVLDEAAFEQARKAVRDFKAARAARSA